MNLLTASRTGLPRNRRHARTAAAPRDIDELLSLLRATLTGLHTLHRPVEPQRAPARLAGRP